MKPFPAHLQRYAHHYVDGEHVFIRKERSLAKVEQVSRDLHTCFMHDWKDNCVPLIKKILYSEEGVAHCKVSHKYSGAYDPWWKWRVTTDLSISFDWVKEPQEPINLSIGQAYYEAERKNQYLVARYSKIHSLFMRLLDQWLWDKDNRPNKIGDVLKLNINERVYFFVATYHPSGTLICWKMVGEPSGALIERTLC